MNWFRFIFSTRMHLFTYTFIGHMQLPRPVINTKYFSFIRYHARNNFYTIIIVCNSLSAWLPVPDMQWNFLFYFREDSTRKFVVENKQKLLLKFTRTFFNGSNGNRPKKNVCCVFQMVECCKTLQMQSSIHHV